VLDASIACEIINKLGLHARAAAKLTHLASGYQSDIWVSRSGGASTPRASWAS